MGGIWRRLTYLFRKDRLARDLQDEMQLHLELRARKLRGQGVADAAHAARRQFGNRTALLETSGEMWGWGACERFAQDLRIALRTLRKTPAFAVVAVLTLAIGLGINTAVFSVVNAVMIRRLPYPEPERVVSLWGEYLRTPPGFISAEARWGGPARTDHSAAEFMDFQRSAHSFLGIAAFRGAARNLTGTGTPEHIVGESVTAGFFPVLGVLPAQGRNFDPEEDRAAANPVVILTHAFWQRRFGGDPDVLARSVMLDGKPHRVVGVLPPRFESPGQWELAEPIEFYLPASFDAEELADYGHRFVDVIARLKPGVSLAAARQEVTAISERVAREHPRQHRDFGTRITPLQNDLVRHVGNPLLALLGASGLIVLITCVNVANLLLVRAGARRHETSVRFALGAGRSRIVRQFLAESMLVAAAGCAAGIVLGQFLLRLLVAIAPADLPRLAGLTMDWRVFSVATAIATITGFAFGIAPAWQASRTRPAESLKATMRNTAGKSQARWRSGLTVAEVALAMILIVGAGLLLKSFVRLMGVDLGFQPERVLAMNVNLPATAYGTPAQRLRFFEQLEARVRALPGVQAATFANRMPLRGSWRTGIHMDVTGETNIGGDAQAVSPGYFATLGISLLRGRLLTPADREGQPPVVVVNREFVRRFLKDVDPIGRRMNWGDDDPWVTIVGMVADIRRSGKDAPIRPGIYLPAAQTSGYPVTLADFAVRSAGDPRMLANAIQSEVWALDRNQPVTNVKTLEEVISTSVAERRFETLLLMAFAAVAVALAVIGVFGVLSYTVSQRTPEWGIRIALGAEPSGILALVLSQAGRLIAAGVIVGLAGAYALTRFLESMLFQVHRTDGWTYLASVALLAAVSLAASLIPARRGAKVDPMEALRYE